MNHKLELEGCSSMVPIGLLHLGASTVKWTTLDPCLGLSESDPKLYTNF